MVDGVEAPGEVLGTERSGNLRVPVVVGVVVAGVEAAVEGLHEAVELGTETVLQGLEVPFFLTPLGSTVLEPNLRTMHTQFSKTPYQVCMH